MYRPFRPTVISGHTRLISGNKMAETYHAIYCARGRRELGLFLRPPPHHPTAVISTIILSTLAIYITTSAILTLTLEVPRQQHVLLWSERDSTGPQALS
jgi:hypothetical protein